MRVTFDTNTYRPVVEPHRFTNHPSHAIFVDINAAIQAGRIVPFVCEALFTIEAIMKVDRAAYLAARRLTSEVQETTTSEGRAQTTITVGPDHSQHPGLSLRETERLEEAIKLGFRLLAQPRIGMARPEPIRLDLHPQRFASDSDITVRQNTFAEVARAIEARDVGFAKAKALGERARKRAKHAATWFELLNDDRYFNEDERKEFAAAVGEWVDGDNVAAHVAYSNDIFCSEDVAGKGRPSIMNTDNRSWLSSTYGVRFATAVELHALL